MPVNLSLVNGQSFTVPEKVNQLDIQMWGAGGGGENVADNFVKTAGGNGGNTELLGLRATGGSGGSTSGGGGSGSGTTTFNWSSLGVSVSTYNGTSGIIPTSGRGALIGSTRYGEGGAGDPGTTTYTSNVTHFFDNDTDRHIFSQTSPDLSVSFENRTAVDGISCTPNYSTKHYRIIFNNSFINSNYSLSVYGICQQAAGGAFGTPYYSAGILDKTSSGFRIWFCNGNAKNTYIRCFSFQTVGQKAGAQGQGGGGGGGVSASFTRQNLIDSATYAPGTNHTAVVGSGGRGYSNGGDGRINIQMLIVPTVTLTVDGSNTGTSIVIGQCVTLSWNTVGDGDTIVWTSGNVDNQNLTSTKSVCPQETTVYTARASGRGGLSEPASVTVVVYYVATASITSPVEINYGEPLYISYETQYADQSITITPYYYFVDGTNSVGDPISITPAVTAESGRPDNETIVSDTQLEIPVPWNTVGPESVQIVIDAQGSGGTAIANDTTNVFIDITPDNLNIQETGDLFKDEDPVFTPDIAPNEVVLSELYLINDIDIPVELKSNYPIEVDINRSDNWQSVREI